MSNTISLTIPRDDEKALVAGATLLLTLAGKVPAMELPDMRDPCEDPSPLKRVADAARDFTHALASMGEGGATEKFTSRRVDKYRPPYGRTTVDVPRQAAVTAPPHPGTVGSPLDADGMPWEPGPVIAPPPPPAVTDGPDLDTDGLPWDARIHSSGKNQIADGTWRKKRGVDQADYDHVVDELRQLMAIPPPPVEQTATVAPPPPPVDEPAPTTFTEFLKAVSPKIQNKELTMADVTAALPEGMANLQLLNGRPDLIPQVWAKLTGGAGHE